MWVLDGDAFSDERLVIKTIQVTDRECGKGIRMFETGWMSIMNQIMIYVTFEVTVNEIPVFSNDS